MVRWLTPEEELNPSGRPFGYNPGVPVHVGSPYSKYKWHVFAADGWMLLSHREHHGSMFDPQPVVDRLFSELPEATTIVVLRENYEVGRFRRR